jgi:hypothetical protein
MGYFQYESHLQKERIYTVSNQQVSEISEIDAITMCVLGILWEEYGCLDKHVGKQKMMEQNEGCGHKELVVNRIKIS